MENCSTSVQDALPPTLIRMSMDERDCNIESAKKFAQAQAEQKDNAPRMLGWYARKERQVYPEVEPCVEGEPGWIAHAKRNGANLTIDINDGDYIFIFHKSHGLP